MEVLAHIGAPSGKKDDDRYEAQARAYAVFQCANRVNLSDRSDEGTFSSDGKETGGLPEPSNEQSSDFFEDSQLAVAALETDLLTSSLKELLGDDTQLNASNGQAELENDPANRSPSPQVPYPGQSRLFSSQGFWDNGEVQADSHTSTWRQQPPYTAIREGNSFGVAFIGTSEQTKDGGREALEDREPPAVCPSLRSQKRPESLLPMDRLQYKATNDPYARHLHPNRNATSKSPLGQVDPNMAESQEKTHEEIPGQSEHGEEQHHTPQVFPNATDPKGKTPDVPSNPSPTAQSELQPPSQSIEEAEGPSIDFRDQPYKFFVETPPIASSKEIPSQFNEAATTIKKLPTIPELKGKYSPQERFRELDPYERGKWTVDTSRWAPQLQLEFWEWMQKHGKSGRLGWNITFFREHDKDADENTIRDSLGTVTVFCWPEVVEHIYLALYVASKGKIAGTGATLRTAAKGELIVQMC